MCGKLQIRIRTKRSQKSLLVFGEKTCGKEVMADNKYEFWHQQRSDGQYYLQRVMTTVNGNVTDITYHEVFGKPISIRRNADRVTYEYYSDGLVKLKSGPNVKMAFEYDSKIKKSVL